MSWACDFEGPEFYREAEVVARKEHRCVECSAPILPGERHLSYAGLWDGSWDSGRQHLLCRDVCVWIRDVLEGECIPFGALSEWWEEHKSPADLGWAWMATGRNRKAPKVYWRIGARMFAMVRRRERLARRAS